ncbi:hypothetical protein DFJ73DRAFT_959478 [Zopfochytrium polystomum]|nr:hypothetical protein DFJ73DRAFT_959478 [Zopfochytrium polystomum]
MSNVLQQGHSTTSAGASPRCGASISWNDTDGEAGHARLQHQATAWASSKQRYAIKFVFGRTSTVPPTSVAQHAATADAACRCGGGNSSARRLDGQAADGQATGSRTGTRGAGPRVRTSFFRAAASARPIEACCCWCNAGDSGGRGRRVDVRGGEEGGDGDDEDDEEEEENGEKWVVEEEEEKDDDSGGEEKSGGYGGGVGGVTVIGPSVRRVVIGIARGRREPALERRRRRQRGRRRLGLDQRQRMRVRKGGVRGRGKQGWRRGQEELALGVVVVVVVVVMGRVEGPSAGRVQEHAVSSEVLPKVPDQDDDDEGESEGEDDPKKAAARRLWRRRRRRRRFVDVHSSCAQGLGGVGRGHAERETLLGHTPARSINKLSQDYRISAEKSTCTFCRVPFASAWAPLIGQLNRSSGEMCEVEEQQKKGRMVWGEGAVG